MTTETSAEQSAASREALVNLVDERTRGFVDTHPWVAAKLLLLEGVRPFRQRPKERYRHHTSDSPQEGFTDRLRQWQTLQATELLIGEALEGRITPKMETKLQRWQNGYPPMSSEFYPWERKIIEEWLSPVEGEASSAFLELTNEFIPLPNQRPLALCASIGQQATPQTVLIENAA